MSVVPAPFRGLPYLKDTTPFFQELSDVMLLISTGEELPAHAAYLAAYSTVFAGILEAHYTSSIHDKRTARIPLPDCSLQEAQIFLCYLYRMRSDAQLSPQSARAIVKVAHKFDVRVALEQCDAFLAQQAAINIRTNSLWACGKEGLEWALFAQQYHLDLLQEETACYIMNNYLEVETLEMFEELGQGMLRRVSRGLAQELFQCSIADFGGRC
ncbi:hypothetical protein COCOBI_14-4000 [Coccomyxa sp. Obi]|nr:hypothetical protein COCOBI_14-4000 [Coccomyxa sp. Obi]